MYFNLRNRVDLVNGENNYLIIDITNKQIYSIDKKFYLIIKKCIKGKHIETITDDFEFLFAKLQELQLLGLGTMSQEYNKIKGKILNKNRLGMLWLNVTSRCNFKCIHCYEKAGETVTFTLNICHGAYSSGSVVNYYLFNYHAYFVWSFVKVESES